MNHTIFKKNELLEWAINEIEEKCKMTVSYESIEDKLINAISNTDYQKLLRKNFEEDVVLDEVQYEELHREIMKVFGYIGEDYSTLTRKILTNYGDDKEKFGLINEKLIDWIKEEIEKKETIYPHIFLKKIIDEYGFSMLPIAIEIINHIIKNLNSSPYYHKSKWGNIEPIKLDDLFNKEDNNSELGCFFDQRYIDYLNKNTKELKDINWRKFEQLSAQFFKNDGYDVELGTGRKDGGIDIVITKDDKKTLVQCKRNIGKIGLGVIKETDWTTTHNDFDESIIICTSDLSKGGYGLINKYGLKLKVINGKAVAEKLNIYSTKI